MLIRTPATCCLSCRTGGHAASMINQTLRILNQLSQDALADRRGCLLTARGVSLTCRAPGEGRESPQCQLQIQAAGLAAARNEPHRRGRLRERHPPQRHHRRRCAHCCRALARCLCFLRASEGGKIISATSSSNRLTRRDPFKDDDPNPGQTCCGHSQAAVRA